MIYGLGLDGVRDMQADKALDLNQQRELVIELLNCSDTLKDLQKVVSVILEKNSPDEVTQANKWQAFLLTCDRFKKFLEKFKNSSREGSSLEVFDELLKEHRLLLEGARDFMSSSFYAWVRNKEPSM